MRKIFYVLMLCLFVTELSAQREFTFGEKFEFSKETEKDFKYVLEDNYNVYLVSAVNEHGMLPSHKMIVRKFDQTLNLINEYSQDFPAISSSSLYDYLGSFQMNQNQVAAFVNVYSGKDKLQNISCIIFDKTNDSFEVKQLASYAIESNSKSGNVSLNVSENGLYAAVVYALPGKRKEPEKTTLTVYNTQTLEQLWTKEVEFNETNAKFHKISEAGEVLFVRIEKGFKAETNQLTLVTPTETKSLAFPEKMALFEPTLFSIGDQDYFFAFYEDKSFGLKFGKFNHFIMYDIANGKILNDNTVDTFTQYVTLAGHSPKEIEDVKITDIFAASDAIQVILQTTYQAGVVSEKVNPMSTMTIDKPLYRYGLAYVVTTDLGGKIVKSEPIKTAIGMDIDVSAPYGSVVINGEMYFNTGKRYGIYKPSQLNEINEESGSSYFNYPERYYHDPNTYINQLISYNRDLNRMVVTRFDHEGKMSLVGINNFIRK